MAFRKKDYSSYTTANLVKIFHVQESRTLLLKLHSHDLLIT